MMQAATENAPLNPSQIQKLQALFDAGDVLLDDGDCAAYGGDNSRLHAMPIAVALPRNAAQVQALVQFCNAEKIPLIARGRGTNTTGAVVPIRGGVVCSFERMNAIKQIDTDNRYAVVEPGVLNGDLQNALKPFGFFWPPDPTSAPYCTIAGNLACNAGGPRTVKYGACRENVLGLEAITGNGELIRVGTFTSKGATGFDLTRLLIGSEGTLALITKATLKLVPLPTARASICARYRNATDAAKAVSRIMAQAVTPCALEFMDHASIRLAREHGGADIPENTGALLMIEVDGSDHALPDAIAAITRACAGTHLNAADADKRTDAEPETGLLACEHAQDAQAIERLWAARKALSPAQRFVAPDKINEDVVVPVSRLPELIAFVENLRQQLGIEVICFGHAGNGNVHVNFLFDRRNPQQLEAATRGMHALFEKVIAMNGTLSGEHGIGIAKRTFMPTAIDANALKVMQGIKQQFDANGILNPGKLLPDNAS